MIRQRLRECFPCLVPAESEDQWTTLTVEKPKSDGKEELTYKVIEKTGRGTFGVVFKVKTLTDEILAMKRIDHNNRHKCREVQMMKQLDHSNVVRLHYFCTQKTYGKYRNTIFMEYMPESLHVFLTKFRQARTPPKDLIVCCLTYQLCRGLAHLHHRGIAHRDIKPRNLLVNRSTNILKICDLGSAKKLDDQEKNITYICSRWYRAPELLFANKKYTVAIDVWSIGCCLAQMIRLEPLFKGYNTADQISKIFKMLGSPTEEEIETLNMVPDLLPNESLPRTSMSKILIHEYSSSMERLLLKFLQYDPANRPGAWEALSDEYFDQLRELDQETAKEQPLPDLFNFTPEELTYPPIRPCTPGTPDCSPDSDSDQGSSPSPSPE